MNTFRIGTSICAFSCAFTGSMIGGTALAADDAPMLDEVVVTAQKREQSLRDVPISISVTTGELLQDFAVRDATDVQAFVPGMVLSRAPDDGLGLTFRGVGSPPRNQSFESSVGMFIDGIFLGKSRLYFSAFFDLDRIEFIKGTQSTLLGKNTSLGAISIATRKPGQALQGKVIGGAELANGGGSVEGAVDVPFSDVFKVRLAGLYSSVHGGFNNEATGHNLPLDEDSGARLTADWQVSDAVDVTAMYQYFRNEHIGSGNQVVLDPNDVIGAIGQQRGVADNDLDTTVSMYTSLGKDGESFKRTTGDLASISFNIDIGPYTLTSQSAYVDYDLDNVDDFDFEAVDEVNFLRTERYRQFTQEMRIASPTDRPVEYLAGVFYLHSDWDSLEHQQWGVPGFPPPPAPISGQLFNGEFVNDFRQKLESYSAFGNVTWHATDRARVTVGLRYTDESKKILFGRTAVPPLTIWNLGANPPFPLTPLRFDDSFLNGNANVQYDLSRDLMVYGSYARGTKMGGYADGVTVLSGDPTTEARIESETATTYEIGGKWTFLQGAAQLDAALFFTRITDFQETEFTGTAFLTKNIPLESRGVDVSMQWQATAGLQLSAGFVYADAEDKATHTRPAAAPPWTANVGWTYRHGLSSMLDLSFGGSVRYRDAQFNQIEEGIPRTSSLTTVDLTLGLGSLDHWNVRLIGRNVFNRLSAEFGYPHVDPFLSTQGVVGGEPNAARSVLLQAELSF